MRAFRTGAATNHLYLDTRHALAERDVGEPRRDREPQHAWRVAALAGWEPLVAKLPVLAESAHRGTSGGADALRKRPGILHRPMQIHAHWLRAVRSVRECAFNQHRREYCGSDERDHG